MALHPLDDPTGKPASTLNRLEVGDAFTKYYFVYGSPDSKSLSNQLQLEHPPKLRPAKVMGARIMMWATDPVLIDGSPEDCALGMMYEAQSPKDEIEFRTYESPTCQLFACWIELEDGTRVQGKTIKWDGNRSELHEGIFDPETRTTYTDLFDPTSKNYRDPMRERNFLSARVMPPLPDIDDLDVYPLYYFFYGSYMDRTRLSEILSLESTPTLRPAIIRGYKIMLWHSYQVLTHASGDIVYGMVYQVQSADDAAKIQRCYEPTEQDLKLCDIRFEDESWVIGRTFMWGRDCTSLEEPSIMPQKLHGSRAWEPDPDIVYGGEIYPQSFFFYGSILDTTRLLGILSVDNTPKLRSASILGYKTMLWDSRSALVDAPGETVPGVEYQVQSTAAAAMIRSWETSSSYKIASCEIRLEDKSWVIGKTLKWTGDYSKLPAYLASPISDRLEDTLKEATSVGSESTIGNSSTALVSTSDSHSPRVFTDSDSQEYFKPEYYFLYASFTDPTRLSKLLSLESAPQLRPARVTGYTLNFIGSSPGLTRDESENTVHGVVYVVQSPKHSEALQAFQTDNYFKGPCLIHLEDGTVIRGQTFEWKTAWGRDDFDIVGEFYPEGDEIPTDNTHQSLVASPSNTPPTNPSVTDNPPQESGPLIMAEKISEGELWQAPANPVPEPVSPIPYFFYGSLMDPAQLQKALSLQEVPTLRSATVFGYKLMLGEGNPALVTAPGEIVTGKVYEVQREEDLATLLLHPSSNYKSTTCMIECDDKTETLGNTFLWVGNKKLLKENSINSTNINIQIDDSYPMPYFFYGTLMDPTRLSRVISLNETPKYHAATVTGFKPMQWGPYLALITAPKQTVTGLMYEVRSAAAAELLQRYETNHYVPRACQIQLQSGARINGRTFVWAGSNSELREGTFDLRTWQIKEYGKAKAMRLRAAEGRGGRMKSGR